MNHTPGPWAMNGREQVVVRDRQGDSFVIADLSHSCFRERQLDNCRLIAAAPDLLEMLQIIYDTVGSYNIHTPLKDLGSIWQRTKDIIAKAEGK